MRLHCPLFRKKSSRVFEVLTAFAPARDSVSWAKDAVTELKEASEGFFQDDVGGIVTQIDGDTGENVQKLILNKRLPKRMARKATEALNNAKNAFDQATFAARNLTGKRSKKSIYYPWSQTPIDLERLLQKRQIDQRLWDTFRSHQPYPRVDEHIGGDDVIRALATLANKKHTIGLGVNGHIAMTRFPSVTAVSVQSLKILTPRWDPEKNEAELIRWIGDVNLEGNYEFRFEVVLQDATFSHPMNAIANISAFTQKAEVVTESLQVRCLEMCG